MRRRMAIKDRMALRIVGQSRKDLRRARLKKDLRQSRVVEGNKVSFTNVPFLLFKLLIPFLQLEIVGLNMPDNRCMS